MRLSVERRLQQLEHRPENAIPKFHVEFQDGHTETAYGGTIIRYHDGVQRITYDGTHQGAVDGAALYVAMYPNVEILPK